jgi:kumamolisin
MSTADRVVIPGSERQRDPAHERVRDADFGKQITVTVYLRGSSSLDWVDGEAAQPVGKQRRLSREEWAVAHGGAEKDVEAVRSFAADHGLRVGTVDLARRSVELHGSVEAVAQAFGAQGLGVFRDPTGAEYRGRHGALMVPAKLDGVVTGVFGIDERPQARPHLRVHAEPEAASSFTPVQVADAYGFPTTATGNGETVAIIELGGGFRNDDLTTYFRDLNLQKPTVTAVAVDGGKNSPGTNARADGEVMLDIEVIGAVAPDASIVVYFAPNTAQGFIDAVSTAVHDTTHNPSVISISWGGAEDSFSGQARQQMEQVFTEAAALGVTVTVAAGDGGSTDGVTDGKQHVDFPASAPHALACGGTSLQTQGAQITNETVWNDADGATGGGVSIEFPLPSYQLNATVSLNVDTKRRGRGVPDVSGDADPETGYIVRVNGARQTFGGTSAVAPPWAGLIALINESLRRTVGFIQPQLYGPSFAVAFRDISDGNNGSYSAGAGWDACTGLGSPVGAGLLSRLGKTPGQDLRAQFEGIVAVAGFDARSDGFQHAVVATADGRLTEVYWGAGVPGPRQDELAQFEGIVAVGGYDGGDGIRHAVVATGDGKLAEVYWGS